MDRESCLFRKKLHPLWVSSYYLCIAFILQISVQVGGQEFMASMSEELIQGKYLSDPVFSEGETQAWEDSLTEEWAHAAQHVETGFDFISDSYLPTLDSEFYLGSDTFSEHNLRKTSLLELVQMFIRELKDLPRKGVEREHSLDSGKEKEVKKPAWVYFPYQLKELAEIEVEIYMILKELHFKDDSFRFPALESYLLDVEESSLLTISKLQDSKISSVGVNEDPYLYIGSHPLLIYRMIRRFAEDLQPILSKLNNKKGVINEIKQKSKSNYEIFPTNKDLWDALESLERIQFIGESKTSDLANGILGNVNTQARVNALQALEIGAFYHGKSFYDLALQWVFLAYEMVNTYNPILQKQPVISNFFLKVLEFTLNEHNHHYPEKIRDLWSPGVFTSLIGTGALNPSSAKRVIDSNKMEAMKLFKKETWNWAMNLNFMQTCSGVTFLTPQEQKYLQCYHFYRNPYWIMIPLKMEVLHLEPTVIQIHDFIGDELAEKIKNSAVEKLKRSEVVVPDDPSKLEVDEARTSSQAWLNESKPEGEFMKKFTMRLEMLSGLVISKKNASDSYQVAMYGSSHHYLCHLDAYADPRRYKGKGNRIVTFMGYLNDVGAGGRTGFPVLGIYANPIKGSIVMWENVKNDVETRDERTRHGGCPVLLGIKWTLTKWVLGNENMLNHLCHK